MIGSAIDLSFAYFELEIVKNTFENINHIDFQLKFC